MKASRGALFWIGSLVVHGALVAALFYVVPLRQLDVGKKSDGGTSLSSAKISALAEDIRAREARELDRHLEDLREIKHDLEEIEREHLERYNELALDLSKNLPADLNSAIIEVLRAQDAALAAQSDATANLDTLEAAQAAGRAAPSDEEKRAAIAAVAAARQQLTAAHEAGKNAQTAAAFAQTRIAQQMGFGSDSFAPAVAAQAEAAALQSSAAQEQQTASEVKESVNTPSVEARRLAGLAGRAGRAADAADKRLADQPARRETLSRTAAQAHTALAEAEFAAALAAATEESPSARQLRLAQARAREAQQAARDRQQRVAELVAAAMEGATLTAQTAEMPAPVEIALPPESAGITEVYETAREFEAAITETYKNVRAAELATQRRIPMTEALAVTEVARPVRPELDEKLLTAPVTEAAEVKEQEREIQTARREIGAMVSLATRMLSLARPEETRGLPVSLETMQAQSEHLDQMEELAMEDEGVQAKDLTGMMTGGSGDIPEGIEGLQPGSGPGDIPEGVPGTTAGQGPGDIPEGGAGIIAGSGSGEAPTGELGTGSGMGKGAGSGSGNTVAGGGPGPGGGGPPPIQPRDFQPIPGRRFTIEAAIPAPPGRNTGWAYVDSWHLIGPFPNPGRQNLNTKFPPETVIDLDAVYRGAGGRPVRWLFLQSPTELIVPPNPQDYVIYYGYTELWFDEPRDAWVAIGSDDQSKVWIENQLIWKSADYMKKWAPNEGFRKVHFKQGLNRVLVRLENGHLNCGFSFIIATR